MADETNSGNVNPGNMQVAGIRATSSQLPSDRMNPAYGFQFTNSDEVVTVKHVEGIIHELHDCFERFIDTQRSYLDMMNNSSSQSTASSDSTNTAADSSQSSTASSSNDSSGLTEQPNFDIIKEEIVESNSSLKSAFEDLSEKVDDISTKIDVPYNDISENITNNLKGTVEENKNENIEENISYNSTDSQNSNVLETAYLQQTSTETSAVGVENDSAETASIASVVEGVVSALKDNSTLEGSVAGNVEENKENDVEKDGYQLLETYLDEVVSIMDGVEGYANAAASLVLPSSSDVQSNTIEESVNEQYVVMMEDASLQMAVANAVENSLGQPMKDAIEKNLSGMASDFGDIQSVQDSTDGNDFIYPVKGGTMWKHADGTIYIPEVDEIPDSEFGDVEFNYGIEPEVVKSESIFDNAASAFKSMFSLFGGGSKEEETVPTETNVENGPPVVQTPSPSVMQQSEPTYAVEEPSSVGAVKTAPSASSYSEGLIEGGGDVEGMKPLFEENRKYNSERFDRIEKLIEDTPPKTVETRSIPYIPDNFGVERIH